MTLVGKFFATHHLNRYMTNKPSYHFSLRKITGKNYDETDYQPYAYTGEEINVLKLGETFRIAKDNFRDVENSLYKYEITEEQYNTVSLGLIPKIEKFINELRESFVAQDFCSGGTWTDEKSSQELLDELKIPFIELAFDIYKAKGSNATILELLR